MSWNVLSFWLSIMFMFHKSPQIILLMHPFNNIKHFLQQLIKAQHCRDTKKSKALPMISALIGCSFEVTLSVGLGSCVTRTWLNSSPIMELIVIDMWGVLATLLRQGGQVSKLTTSRPIYGSKGKLCKLTMELRWEEEKPNPHSSHDSIHNWILFQGTCTPCLHPCYWLGTKYIIILTQH